MTAPCVHLSLCTPSLCTPLLRYTFPYAHLTLCTPRAGRYVTCARTVLDDSAPFLAARTSLKCLDIQCRPRSSTRKRAKQILTVRERDRSRPSASSRLVSNAPEATLLLSDSLDPKCHALLRQTSRNSNACLVNHWSVAVLVTNRSARKLRARRGQSCGNVAYL